MSLFKTKTNKKKKKKISIRKNGLDSICFKNLISF